MGEVTLNAGSQFGPYEIVALLGSGGMGDVYRAHDPRLRRDVAIKLLQQRFATDSNHLARFTREAHALASLNDPHIAAVYDVTHIDGLPALVMELVEGQTLADRLANDAIPLGEALGIAHQIAAALEVAHDHGIIHRDLKPANVKVTTGGNVKLLDFGLARVFDPTVGVLADDTDAGTVTTPAVTHAGVLLGTAAYMAPEQARGEVVDKRADIWALGVVLFEMLTGRPAFPGRTITDVLAAVVTAEPDWSALSDGTPESLRRLLQRCLQKDLRHRMRDAGDARMQIEDVLTGLRRKPDSAEATNYDIWVQSFDSDGRATDARVFAASRDSEGGARVSADGRYIAYLVAGQSIAVYVANFPDGTGKQAVSSGPASDPVWRPDRTELYFTRLAGGPPELYVTAVTGAGPTVSESKQLFRLPSLPPTATARQSAPYAVSKSGARFLVMKQVKPPRSTPIIVTTGAGTPSK